MSGLQSVNNVVNHIINNYDHNKNGQIELTSDDMDIIPNGTTLEELSLTAKPGYLTSIVDLYDSDANEDKILTKDEISQFIKEEYVVINGKMPKSEFISFFEDYEETVDDNQTYNTAGQAPLTVDSIIDNLLAKFDHNKDGKLDVRENDSPLGRNEEAFYFNEAGEVISADLFDYADEDYGNNDGILTRGEIATCIVNEYGAVGGMTSAGLHAEIMAEDLYKVDLEDL